MTRMTDISGNIKQKDAISPEVHKMKSGNHNNSSKASAGVAAGVTAGPVHQPSSSFVGGGVREFKDVMSSYDPSSNKTSPIITRYERAKLLGIRTEQIARGSKPMITVADDSVPCCDIAMEEMLQKKTPFVLVRNMPDGSHEYWKIKDMIVY